MPLQFPSTSLPIYHPWSYSFHAANEASLSRAVQKCYLYLCLSTIPWRCILSLSTGWRLSVQFRGSVTFTAGKGTPPPPVTHWIGGRVGPRAGLDVTEGQSKSEEWHVPKTEPITRFRNLYDPSTSVLEAFLRDRASCRVTAPQRCCTATRILQVWTFVSHRWHLDILYMNFLGSASKMLE